MKKLISSALIISACFLANTNVFAEIDLGSKPKTGPGTNGIQTPSTTVTTPAPDATQQQTAPTSNPTTLDVEKKNYN